MSRMTWILILGVAIVLAVLAWQVWPSDDASHIDSSDVAANDFTPDSPYWTSADRWVDVDGVRARVRIEGEASAPAIVLIHGFSFSLESWDGWAEQLSQTHRVVRMDLPGHALTGPDPRARYSVDQTVDFVEGLLAELGIENAVLGGNSLGGLVAWKLAARRPDLVDRLVLVAPGGFSINGVTEDPVPVPAAVSFYLTQAPQPMISAATSGLFGDATRMDSAMARRVGDLMREGGVGRALVERLEVFTLPAPEAELAQVIAPTLILWGGRDRMVPPEHASGFLDAMPEAELVAYPELGHIPHEEDATRTLADVSAFLQNRQ